MVTDSLSCMESRLVIFCWETSDTIGKFSRAQNLSSFYIIYVVAAYLFASQLQIHTRL